MDVFCIENLCSTKILIFLEVSIHPCMYLSHFSFRELMNRPIMKQTYTIDRIFHYVPLINKNSNLKLNSDHRRSSQMIQLPCQYRILISLPKKLHSHPKNASFTRLKNTK